MASALVFCVLVCCCLEVGKRVSSGIQLRQEHLPSIWSSTSTVFKVWSSCCLPLCTALLLTATLENDFELQCGSKWCRDVSLLRFLTYTCTLHSTPVSPPSVFQSWSHNQSCIYKFHPQNLSVAFRKKNLNKTAHSLHVNAKPFKSLWATFAVWRQN